MPATRRDIEISQNSTWLVTSRLDTTRHVRRVERVETRRACRAVLFQHGGRRTGYMLACTILVVFMLLHTQILFVQSNEII